MKLTVACFGVEIQLDLAALNTIANVKEKITEICNLPAEKQLMSFQKRLLQDDETLASCGLVDHSKIILKLEGVKNRSPQYKRLRRVLER